MNNAGIPRFSTQQCIHSSDVAVTILKVRSYKKFKTHLRCEGGEMVGWLQQTRTFTRRPVFVSHVKLKVDVVSVVYSWFM